MDDLEGLKHLCLTFIKLAGGLFNKQIITHQQYEEMVRKKVEFLKKYDSTNS